MRPDQHGHQPPGLDCAGAGERGGRVLITVRARVQAKQAEQPCGIGGQAPVGPGEHASHRGVRVTARIQQLQPVLLAQVRGQRGQRRVRPGHGQLSCDPQRQRQPRTLLR